MSLTGETRPGSTLLERDGLLARLEHLVDLAGDGARSMAMIAGEAGAGKTSLMTELTRRIEGRGRVLIGGCDPLATPRPLSPLLDIAADPEAHFTGPGRLDLDPFSLFSEVLDDLKGPSGPHSWSSRTCTGPTKRLSTSFATSGGGSPTPKRWWLAPTERTS